MRRVVEAYREHEAPRIGGVGHDSPRGGEKRQLQQKDVLHQLALHLLVEVDLSLLVAAILLGMSTRIGKNTSKNSERTTTLEMYWKMTFCFG